MRLRGFHLNDIFALQQISFAATLQRNPSHNKQKVLAKIKPAHTHTENYSDWENSDDELKGSMKMKHIRPFRKRNMMPTEILQLNNNRMR